MATTENTRSLFLASANPRLLTTANADVLLGASAYLFHVNTAGVPNTASIVFAASPIAMDSSATFTYSIVGGTLTGVSGKDATLLYTNMTADTATITVTATYRGVQFVRSVKVTKLFDVDVADVDISPEALKDILEGQITESELYADLRARINLVDGAVTLPNSVSAKVKAETDARVAAIAGEASARTSAISAETDARVVALTQEASNRTTYVQGYTYSKAQADEAISIKADTITAAYTAYANTQRDAAVSTASADVRNYSYSKAAADSALAAQSTALTTAYQNYAQDTKDSAIYSAAADVRTYAYSKSDTNAAIASTATELRSEFSANNGASVAWVQNYAYSKSAIDSAEAAQTSNITAAYTTYTDAAKTAAINTASADVRNYSYSKAETNSALASQSTTLTTAYQNYAQATKDSAIYTAAADVRDYSYSKSGTDSAIASTATQLRAEFTDNNGVSVAYLENYAYSKAGTNSAISSATSSLSTTVGQHTTTLQTQATSLNGLSAQYTVKVDNNGYVSGFGLASTNVNGTPTSSFIINAANFAVVAPGVAPKVMFSVGNVNGQSTIGINGNLIVDGSFVMRNAAGVPVVTLTGLQPGFEAPGTKNSEQLWSQVGGPDKPADNATSDIALVAKTSAVTVSGNTVTKTGGAVGVWDADTRSKASYVGGAYAVAVAPNLTSRAMFGLNSDPQSTDNYVRIDYAIYIEDGSFYIYESGVQKAFFGAYGAGDSFSVVFDDVSVRYLKNDTVLRTVAASTASPLFFDCAMQAIGSTITGVRFGPMSSGAAGAAANNALPAINQAITEKLSRTSASSLAATITVSTGGSILAGTTSNGTYMSPSGFYGVQGGVVKISVPISGEPTFGGQLTAPSGTLASLRVMNEIYGGSFTATRAWPSSGGGFHLSPLGLLIGNANSGKFVDINANGEMTMPGFQHVGGQLTLTSTVIISPSITGGINLAPIPEISSSGGSGVRTVTRTASVSNAKGAVRYRWRFVEDQDNPGVTISAGATSATVTLRCLSKTAGYMASGILYCDVIDDNNMVDSEWCNVYFYY